MCMKMEISKAEKLPYVDSGYSKIVIRLRYLNKVMGFYDSPLEFAKALFNEDMTNRFNWLEDLFGRGIMQKNINLDMAVRLERLLNSLRGAGNDI
jgi:hypothetical protein